MSIDSFKAELKRNPFSVLSDLVYKYILEEIIEVHYIPGEKINAKHISEELDISRTPVRAALNRLTAEGLVEQVGEKGFRVCQINWSDCLALYDIRGMIESNAAHIAANRISQKNLNKLKTSIEMMKEAKEKDDTLASFAADNLFHYTIVEATDNDYLISMHEKLRIYLRLYQRFLFATGKYTIGNDNHIIDKHIVIYRAISNSYSQVAKNEMDDHLRYIYRILFDGGVVQSHKRKRNV